MTMNSTEYTPREALRCQAANPRLPLWVRVCAYAVAHATHGHARLYTGELRDLEPTASGPAMSDAIRRAVRNGWLDPRSSARCLVLVGAGAGRCGAAHKGGS